MAGSVPLRQVKTTTGRQTQQHAAAQGMPLRDVVSATRAARVMVTCDHFVPHNLYHNLIPFPESILPFYVRTASYEALQDTVYILLPPR